MKTTWDLTLRVIAVAVLLSGIGMAIHTVRATPARFAKINAKKQTLAQLAGFRSDQAREQAAQALFDDLESRKPVPLPDLVAETFGRGSGADVRMGDTRAAAGGWKVRAASVFFNEVALDQAGILANRAERQRPPWRLRAARFQATASRPGFGRVELELEALDKPEL